MNKKDQKTNKNVPLQPASLDIWDKKYRLKDKKGKDVEDSMEESFERVARALSDLEKTPELRAEWYKKFMWALEQGAIPAGRIMSNAGASEYKSETSPINCVVSNTIHDSMDDIMKKLHEAALTLKRGCVAKGTLVVTNRGVIPIEQAVEEKHEKALSYNVKTRQFEFKKILRHLTPVVKDEDSIRIVTSDGACLPTSKKHPVLIYRNGKTDYISAGEVRLGDAIIKHHLSWGNSCEEKSLDAWFAGAHLGDGAADFWRKNKVRGSDTNAGFYKKLNEQSPIVRFRILAAEKEVVEKYAQFFTDRVGSEASISMSQTKCGTNVWEYYVASRAATEMALPLVNNTVGKKSHNLQIPSWIKQNPEKYFIPFLAGLLDTDGTVSLKQKSAIYSSVCASFVLDVQQMLSLFGVSSGLHTTTINGKAHMLGDRMIVSPKVTVLKICDSSFLATVSKFMVAQKKERLNSIDAKSGQYEKNVISTSLKEKLIDIFPTLSHTEKQKYRLYHKAHLGLVASRDLMASWSTLSPELSQEVSFCKKLRHVEQIETNLGLDETFYDFEVEGHHNYVAGNNGLMVIHNCGIGYEFSTLRPKNAFVAGAGANTSGPMSFMDIYDKMCFTVSSAGGRRGAQMATFDVSHPDVQDFIKAKREDGRLRQFNLSLLITDDFMNAVKKDQMWKLTFPVSEHEKDELDFDNSSQVVWKEWPVHDGYTVRDDGLVAHKVYRSVKARHLWDMIMTSTYNYAEPGFILIDKANEMNNNWFEETFRATNPCGEQILSPGASCLLGSINLTNFVQKPFTDKASFDWERFKETTRIFTRMLDNVVDINNLPLEIQRSEIIRKRRHGMGFLGLGSAMTMMGMPYGSEESLIFTDEVSKVLAVEGWKEALNISKEKGPAPLMLEEFEVTKEMLRKRPEMKKDGYRVGDKVLGKILHAKYSRYMQKIAEVEPELVEELAKIGARFTHHTSIAPTGTIALSFGNNASNGIEPSFAHHYSRNIIREGKKSKEKVDVYSYELLAYRHLVNPDAMPYSSKENEKLPSYFISAEDISPKEHVDVQAAAQVWVDSAISKTANVPTDYPFEDFKEIYMYAYEKGLKGCTTFRFNPEAFQGVLVKEKDLENTVYVFTLNDGTEVELKGNEDVEYDGEIHSAANLFDALKEGYYGKF